MLFYRSRILLLTLALSKQPTVENPLVLTQLKTVYLVQVTFCGVFTTNQSLLALFFQLSLRTPNGEMPNKGEAAVSKMEHLRCRWKGQWVIMSQPMQS